MSPEFEYFKQYSLWKRMVSWLTGNPLRVSRLVKPALRYRFAVEYFKDHPMEVIQGSGRAISARGVRFATAIPPKKGQELEMRVRFLNEENGDQECVKINARVTHAIRPPGRSRYRVGCEWLDLDIKSKERIMTFLHANFVAV